MKRLFDLLASAIGLAILAPLIACAMVAIRITSPGPAIFAHTRVGRNGRLFTIYKLRTMHQGTGLQPSHDIGPDAISPIGARLRGYKLDELPQLVNVFLGQMSLVGPRPCLPTQTALIEARRQGGVLHLLPGITGLAQVQGIDMADPIKLAVIDAQYARNRGFFYDLRLIGQTISGRGLGKDPASRSSRAGKTTLPSDHL